MIDGIKLSGAVWAKYWSLLFYPQQLFDYARTHAALTLEIGKLVGLTDDTPTLFKGRPLGTKRASWSERLTLSAVQAVARAHQATPDAVLLSCLAGALRNFLEAQGAPTDGVELRTLMPVNLRNADAREVLGNRGGMLALELPVGIKDPLARLHEVERRMEVFQEAYQAANTLGLFNLIGQASRAARDAVLQLIATKASALFCHIPASPTPRYLNGVKIVEQMFWSPASGELGLSMSILSYDGHYQVGLIADAAMLPDPNLITGRIADELAALTPAAPDAPKPAAKPPGKPRARKAAP
jgi:WS/DGAT/MGAT family acyltransferase